MPHESEYYNLESVPNGWSSDEFSFVVHALEALDKPALAGLASNFGIHFTSSAAEDVDEEQLIAALIDDAPKEQLIQALQEQR